MVDVNDAHDVREHEYWDFSPARPPLKDERPDAFPDDPSDEDEYQAYYESRCGTPHESRPVELYDGEFEGSERFVDIHQGPVGQIQWNHDLDDLDIVHDSLDRYEGVRWCSGTLIDDDLLLTAGHCLVLHNMPRPAEVARNMHVNFNYQLGPHGDLRSEREYEVVELVEHEFEHGGLDYAILKLGREPGSEFGTADVAATDARKGDTLCIISHPDGLPKRVEAGHVTHLHDVRIGYGDIDTAHGSSGAGILESPSGALVGVHTMGGCDRTRSGHNHGIRISAIIEASSTIQRLASRPPAPDDRPTKGTHRGHGTPPATDSSVRQHRHEPRAGEAERDGGSHGSTLESHRSTLESHRSTLESHRSTLELSKSRFESHRATLEANRAMLELHEATLESSREGLSEFEDALDECTRGIRTLAEELREQADTLAGATERDDGPNGK